MKKENAIFMLQNIDNYLKRQNDYSERNHDAIMMAIKALSDNKPSRTWIAKNEYRRGWHDAITKALSEALKIHVENETFDMVQKETLIGLGLSMDSALGAKPYSETDESYPEPDRPHGEWKPSWSNLNESYCSCCNFTVRNELKSYFCPKCGSDNRPRGEVK